MRGQLAEPPDAELRDGEADAARQPAGQGCDAPRQPRWDVVERLAREQHEAGHALHLGARPLGEEHDRAAPVGDAEGDVPQVQALQELAEQARDPPHGQVGAGVHRTRMSAQRQHRPHDPPVAARPVRLGQLGQLGQHRIPHARVHQQAVREQEHGPAAAAVLAGDRSRRQFHLGRFASPARSTGC